MSYATTVKVGSSVPSHFTDLRVFRNLEVFLKMTAVGVVRCSTNPDTKYDVFLILEQAQSPH